MAIHRTRWNVKTIKCANPDCKNERRDRSKYCSTACYNHTKYINSNPDRKRWNTPGKHVCPPGGLCTHCRAERLRQRNGKEYKRAAYQVPSGRIVEIGG